MIVLDVALRLKELRELRGISVNKLSNMAGLSQSFVREIELGRKNPTVDSLSYCARRWESHLMISLIEIWWEAFGRTGLCLRFTV